MIDNLPEYIKLLNTYNPLHYPANKKISAEEWNALWLSSMHQGNHQEDIIANILNNHLPEIISNTNSLLTLTDSHSASIISLQTQITNNDTDISQLQTDVDIAYNNANDAVSTANNAESNSETAVSTANEAKAIALGVEQAKVFNTFEDMEIWLKDEANKGLHTTGLELLIKDANVPDYWVSAVLETPNANGYYYDIEESEASVLSVNGKKGVVVLKTDDILDAEQTNKWSTAEEKEKVSKIITNGDGTKALLNDGTYGEVGTIDTVSINGGEPILPDENKNIDITITADSIPDSTTTNKFATAAEKTVWNNKADKATTIDGYGITDGVTRTGTETLTNKTLTTPIIDGDLSLYAGEMNYGLFTTAYNDLNIKALTGNFNFYTQGPVAMRIFANANTSYAPYNFNNESSTKSWLGYFADYNGTTYRARCGTGGYAGGIEFNAGTWNVFSNSGLSNAATFIPNNVLTITNAGVLSAPTINATSVLQIGGSITDGTNTYTPPSSTGTLALTSDIDSAIQSAIYSSWGGSY